MANRVVACPRCDVPLRLPEPVRSINYRADLALLEQLVGGELNVVPHFCGARIAVFTPLAVADPLRRAVIIVGRPETPVPAPDVTVTHLSDYASLEQTVTQWLVADFEELWAERRDDRFDELPRTAQIEVMRPTGLLGLALEVRGRRRVQARGTDLGSDGDLSPLLTWLVSEQIRRLTLDAGDTATVAELPGLIRRHIPRLCLEDQVLEALLDSCDDEMFATTLSEPEDHGDDGGPAIGQPVMDRNRVAPGFRAELAASVAHLVAGRPNPREHAWAGVLAALWYLSRTEWASIDDRFFLDRESLRATVSFPLLLDAARRLYFRGPIKAKDVTTELRVFEETFAGLMDRAGYSVAFAQSIEDQRAELLSRVSTLGPPEPVLLALHEDVRRRVRDEEDGPNGEDISAALEEARWLGVVASAMCENIASTHAASAIDYVRAAQDYVAANSTPVALMLFVRQATEWLNRSGLHQLAAELVDCLPSLSEESLAVLTQAERLALWNEIGNTYRYGGRSLDALEAYERAEVECSGVPDEDASRRTLIRNRAIVFRELGLFGESLALLEQLGEAGRVDPETLHSRALFAAMIGRQEEAVGWLDEALAIPGLPLPYAAKYLTSRADGLRQLGEDDQAVTDLAHAWDMAVGGSALDLKLSIAATAMAASPQAEPLRQFRDSCRSFILEHVEQLTPPTPRGLLGASLALAEEALDEGDVVLARRLLEQLVREPGRPDQVHVGQIALDWGWLLLLEGSSDPWPWFHQAMLTVDSNVPRGDDAMYALTWLRSAGPLIDRLLSLVPLATDDPVNLLALYELANGRELSVAREEPSPDDWLVELRRLVAGTADVVALLDTGDGITGVVVPAVGEARLLRLVDDQGTLEAALAELSRFDAVNPVAPHRSDPRMARWWNLAATLADGIRPHLSTGAELIILPGRRLAAAPLHLAGWPEEPLIASRPVSVSPNLRVLLGRGDAAPGHHMGVVAVPKRTDRPEFVAALRATTEDIVQLTDATALTDLDAHADAILELGSDVQEIVFLCHGVSTAGTDQGAGICIAAHGHLPVSPLPVEADPGLADFALSWADLVTLTRTPRILVTIACSTGRVLIGPGGSRLGLEQGFLTRGGDAIVSPLWNVDQAASLAWLRAFYSAHEPASVTDLPKAYQTACLTVREQFPHPYAWGPFALTRRLTGES